MSDLDKKVKSSIRLIKTLDGLEPELAYSGGKDSDVILALAQMSGIKFHPIYKMTTIDPPGTLAHVKSKGVEIRKPKMTFFEIVRYAGMPNSAYRVCCS
jgi:phosphoadenosine phosphosulfate reductase